MQFALLEPGTQPSHDLRRAAVVAEHVADDGTHLLHIDRVSRQQDLGGFRVVLNGAQWLAELMRQRGRELAEHRDPARVRQLAPQLGRIVLCPSLLRHIAQDAADQREIAPWIGLDCPCASIQCIWPSAAGMWKCIVCSP